MHVVADLLHVKQTKKTVWQRRGQRDQIQDAYEQQKS